MLDLNGPWGLVPAFLEQSDGLGHVGNGRCPVTWTSFDRWTCPACGVTEVVDSRDAGTTRIAIRLAQDQHARDHAPDPPPGEPSNAADAA